MRNVWNECITEPVLPLHIHKDGHLKKLFFITDMSAEEIQLENSAESLAVGALPRRVPDSAARYHLYRYDHNYEGDFYHSVCECCVIAVCSGIRRSQNWSAAL